MTSNNQSAQFLSLEFQLLNSPAFLRSMAFLLYLQLRRYVWRGKNKRHPLAKVNELFAAGYLVCAVPRSTLAERLGIREASHISRYLSDLEKRGLLRKVRTGRQNVYVLGNWRAAARAGGRGSMIETYFLGGDVSSSDTSDVSSSDTSDVSLATPYNKEVNKEKNRSGSVSVHVPTLKEFGYVPKYEPRYLEL